MLLVVDRKTSAISLEGAALRVSLAEGGFRRIPLNLLSQVVVHGAVPVSCDVFRALAERGIGAVLLAGRGHKPVAFAGAGLAPFVGWRLRQFAAFQNGATKMEIVRELLSLKFSVYAAAALSLPSSVAVETRAAQLQARERLASARDLASLRGIEGATAAAWFSALRKVIDPFWLFTGRNRHPPRDPVNALLSLAYTLTTSAVADEVLIQGLDPALGFLHVPAPHRPALSLDLVEPLRALVDVWVLTQLAQYVPEDFTLNEQDGCRLSKDARSRFYAEWQTARASSFGLIYQVLKLIGAGAEALVAESFSSADNKLIRNAGSDTRLDDADTVPEISLSAACRYLVAWFRRVLPANVETERPLRLDA